MATAATTTSDQKFSWELELTCNNHGAAQEVDVKIYILAIVNKGCF